MVSQIVKLIRQMCNSGYTAATATPLGTRTCLKGKKEGREWETTKRNVEKISLLIIFPLFFVPLFSNYWVVHLGNRTIHYACYNNKQFNETERPRQSIPWRTCYLVEQSAICLPNANRILQWLYSSWIFFLFHQNIMRRNQYWHRIYWRLVFEAMLRTPKTVRFWLLYDVRGMRRENDYKYRF